MTLGEAFAEIDFLHDGREISNSVRSVMRKWLQWAAIRRVPIPDHIGRLDTTTGGILVWAPNASLVVQIAIPSDVDTNYEPQSEGNRLTGCVVDIVNHINVKTGRPTLVFSVLFPRKLRHVS